MTDTAFVASPGRLPACYAASDARLVPFDGGSSVVSATSVAAMTTDRLTAEQRRGPSAQTVLDGFGWGYGVQVATPEYDASVHLARYGWGGGLGTLWYSWPDKHAAAVLLTQVLPLSTELITAFVNEAERCLAAA